jgi:ribosomal protein L24
MGYEGVIKRLMDIWDCTFEQAKTIFGRMGYEGRVASVMRDHGFTNEEEARTHIGHTCYAATILAIMGFFGCNEKKARSMFGESGGKAKGKITRVDDERKECTIEGCNRIQERLSNPLCKKCKAEKRKSEETEVKIKRCVMCGETEDDRIFSTKEYCKKCYKSVAGKRHREERKEEMFVLCSVPGCTCKASKGGKCALCYNGSH